MPEQDVRTAGKWRAICPHGKAKGHCTGPYINIRVVRKRLPRQRRADWKPAPPIGESS